MLGGNENASTATDDQCSSLEECLDAAGSAGDGVATDDRETTYGNPDNPGSEPSPDGGWGWMVVAASFLAHVIADGSGFSFGILFSELLDEFQESTSRTAWVGSLFVSVPAICGPIASAVTNAYGCRRTTMMGGLIAAVGCFLSAYARSIGQLCFSFGIIAGFGLSLVFVPSVVIVAFYFEKKRAFATGIAVAGSGIGTFIFAPLIEYLIDEFHWRGALIITSGIMLNIVMCGALYRPLGTRKKHVGSTSGVNSNKNQLSRYSTPNILSSNHTETMKLCDDSTPRYISRSHPEILLWAQLGFDGDDPGSSPEPIVVHSMVLIPPRKHPVETCKSASFSVSRCETLERDGKGRRSFTSNVLMAASSSFACRGQNSLGDVRAPSIPTSISAIKGQPSFVTFSNRKSNMYASDRCIHLRRRQDIVYRGSLLRAGFFLKNGRSASCPEVFHRPEEKLTLFQKIKNLTFGQFAKEVVDRCNDLIDLSVFKSAIFNYFCMHTVLLYISYDIPYVYGPVRAIKYGMSDNYASLLVSVIGIFSTVGEVVMGVVGDLGNLNILHFYNTMTLIAGLVTLLVPLVVRFLPLSILFAIYGFCISANLTLTTVILVELLGMQKLTNAFGIVSLAQGIANLLGPPLAGWLSDSTGSYDVAFYGAGAIICLSGWMLFAAPCLEQCEKSLPKRIKMENLPIYIEQDEKTCRYKSNVSEDRHSIVLMQVPAICEILLDLEGCEGELFEEDIIEENEEGLGEEVHNGYIPVAASDADKQWDTEAGDAGRMQAESI